MCAIRAAVSTSAGNQSDRDPSRDRTSAAPKCRRPPTVWCRPTGRGLPTCRAPDAAAPPSATAGVADRSSGGAVVMTSPRPPSRPLQHTVAQIQGARAQLLQPGEVMRDDHDGQPLLAAQFLEQPQQTALGGGVQARQRLVEDQRPRRARQQAGQHHPAHLTAAELVDAPLGQRAVQSDDGQRGRRRGHGPSAKTPPPKPLPSRPGCASAAVGPPGTTAPPRRPAHRWVGRQADRSPVVGTVSPAMIHASVDLPDRCRRGSATRRPGGP